MTAYRAKLYQIHVHAVCGTVRVPVETRGFLNFIELPASNKPGSSQLAEEYMNANNSLRSVGEVLSALASRDRPAPFESSRLTSMLQPFLGKDSKVLMVFNLSPQATDFPVTMNTLKYASNLKNAQASQQMAKRPPMSRGVPSRPNDPAKHGNDQMGSSSQGNMNGFPGRMDGQNDTERRDYQNSFGRQNSGHSRGSYGGRNGSQNNFEERGRNFGRENHHGSQFSHGQRQQGFGGGQNPQYQNNQMRQRRPTDEGTDSFNQESDQDVLMKAGYKPFQIAQMTPQQKAGILERERKTRNKPSGVGRPGGADRDLMGDLGFDNEMDIEEMNDQGKLGLGAQPRSQFGSASKPSGFGRSEGPINEGFGPGASQNSSKHGTGKKKSSLEVIDDEVSSTKEYLPKTGKPQGGRGNLTDEIDLDEPTGMNPHGMQRGYQNMNQPANQAPFQPYSSGFAKADDSKPNQFGGMGMNDPSRGNMPPSQTQFVNKSFQDQQNFGNPQGNQTRAGTSVPQDAFKAQIRPVPDAGIPQNTQMNRETTDPNVNRAKPQGQQGNFGMMMNQQLPGFVGSQLSSQFQNAVSASQNMGKGPMFNQQGQLNMNPSQFGQFQQAMMQESFNQSPKQTNLTFPNTQMGRQNPQANSFDQMQYQTPQINQTGDFQKAQGGNFGFGNQPQQNFNRTGSGNFSGDRGNMFNQGQPQNNFGMPQSQDESDDEEDSSRTPQNNRSRPQEFQNASHQRQPNFGFGGQGQGDQGYMGRHNPSQGGRGGYHGGNHPQQYGHGPQGGRDNYESYGGGHQQFNRQGGFQGQGHQGNYQNFQGGNRHQGGNYGGRPPHGMRGGHRGQSNYRN